MARRAAKKDTTVGDMADDARASEEQASVDAEEEFSLEGRMMRLGQKEYLPVAHRVVWFHQNYPQGSITTELIKVDENFAFFKATVQTPLRNQLDDVIGIKMATGYGSETQGDFRDYIEKAETKSVGRALANFGLGTVLALDEGGSVADAPQARRTTPPPRQPYDRRATGAVEATTPQKDTREPSADEIASTGQIEGSASDSVEMIAKRLMPLVSDLGWNAQNGGFATFASEVLKRPFDWKAVSVSEMIVIEDKVRVKYAKWEKEQIDKAKEGLALAGESQA